jgi:MFS family permease
VKLIDTMVPREFRASVRGPLRRFYVCTVISCLGFGLTLSLFVVYLHNVRGFSTSFATLLLALSAVVGLMSAPAWGTMTDRLGPVRVILVADAGQAASLVLFGFAHDRPEAIVTTLLLAVFGGAGWGPGTTMMSRLVAPEQRQWAFGLNFMLVNLGIGFGGLLSASIVDLARPDTFVGLYVINAAVTLVAAGFFFTLRAHGGPVTDHHDDPVKSAEGWREVLRDKLLVRYVIASVVLMLGGYGSLDAGFSLFVVNNLHLSVHAIGVMFFFNTSTIVLAQVYVLGRIEGRSRTRLLGLVSLFWCSFWLILELGLALPADATIACLCLAMSIFAVGETMFSPVGSAIINEIAPEHLRGRYNTAAQLSWSIAGTLAPAITALYFSIHLGDWWPLGTGATALVGGAMMVGLRHHISAVADGRVEPAS